MNELEKEIRSIIEQYYDKKLRKSSYYNDQDIWDIIEQHILDLQDLVEEKEQEIDNLIEDNEYLPTRYEMMQEYDRFRQDELGGLKWEL